MKILVRFNLNEKHDNFEGARLRKTIKGSLEVANIPYTDWLLDSFDVAHFIYVEDDDIIEELNERRIPIVVSALYSEDDPYACYLEYKDKNNPSHYSLKPKCAKFLNKANLVLVPNESAKQILIDNGITTQIDICPPAINLSRFDFSRDDEKDIFYRYFNCDIDKTIAVAIGRSISDIDNVRFVKAITSIAEEYENMNFYYFSSDGDKVRKRRHYRRLKKKLPRNVIISDIVPDDVYRSTLLNADLFLVAGEKISSNSAILEAMAAKCQLVVKKQDFFKELAIDKETAYIAEDDAAIETIIKEYIEGKLKPTIDKAYQCASKYDINALGKRLQDIYQQLIDKKGD